VNRSADDVMSLPLWFHPARGLKPVAPFGPAAAPGPAVPGPMAKPAGRTWF